MCDATIALAVAIYFESRSEPLAGQYAVAETILNRVESKRFPNTVCGVVMQPNQFSYFWDGKQELVIQDQKAWEVAQAVARNSLNKKLAYHGSCHYTHKNIRRVWMKDMKRVMVIGDHKFIQGGC
jgi:spore germination cell wall hydrolase CwlJ-like protein